MYYQNLFLMQELILCYLILKLNYLKSLFIQEVDFIHGIL